MASMTASPSRMPSEAPPTTTSLITMTSENASSGKTATSPPPSWCCSEAPLLSQDEFFRHLQLQSVHTTKVKFTYRQALKERLRANPKKVNPETTAARTNNNNVAKAALLPPKTPPPPAQNGRAGNAAVTPHISPKWLSPQSCRRIFGRPKVRREKKALNFDAISLQSQHERSSSILATTAATTATSAPSSSVQPPQSLLPRHDDEPPSLLTTCLTKSITAKSTTATTSQNGVAETKKKEEGGSSSSSILGPLINNCHLYRHPKVTEEIEAFGLAKKRRKENPDEPAAENKQTILERRNYLAEREARRRKRPATRRNNALKEEEKVEDDNKTDYKEYEPAIRIQPGLKGSEQEEEDSPLFKLLNPPTVMLQKKKAASHLFPAKGERKSSAMVLLSSIPTSGSVTRLKHVPETPPVRAGSPALMAAAGIKEFKCRHCDRIFASHSGLVNHEENGHQTCLLCRKTLRSLWRKSRRPSPHSVCKACAKRFPLAADLSLSALPLLLPLIGLQCKRSLPWSEVEGSHRCDLCAKVFGKRDLMIRHLLGSHASELHKVDLAKFVPDQREV